MKLSRPPIVHIGLGKTGTTSLQRYVFPEMAQRFGYLYNPKPLFSSSKWMLDDSPTIERVRAFCDENSIFVSNEGLVNWNPRCWETSADKVLAAFGERARIILCLRDPREYMTALYIQKIQEGNVMSPSTFFVSRIEYERLKPFLSERALLRLDHHSLDYEKLIQIYESRFPKVYVVPYTKLSLIYPFGEIFGMSSQDRQIFKRLLANSPRRNRSYSASAVYLTVKREMIAGIFGLRSIGSEDLSEASNKTASHGVHSLAQQNLYIEQPVRRLIHAVVRRILRNLWRPWRWWMQSFVDNVLPYRKYRLPKYIVDQWDVDLMERNRKLLGRLETKIEASTSSFSVEEGKNFARVPEKSRKNESYQ